MHMKKIIVSLFAIMMISTFMMPASADEIQTITITVENYAVASILLNETAWATSAPLGDSETELFNLENNGSVTVDVAIRASNTTNWFIDSSPAHNNFALRYNNTGGAVGDVEISWPDSTFYEGMAHDGDVDFVLTLLLPVTSSVATAQEITVTFTATPS